MNFYSLRKFKNICLKIRNKSADCSKNINLMSKISLQYALSCAITISSKRIFIGPQTGWVLHLSIPYPAYMGANPAFGKAILHSRCRIINPACHLNAGFVNPACHLNAGFALHSKHQLQDMSAKCRICTHMQDLSTKCRICTHISMVTIR